MRREVFVAPTEVYFNIFLQDRVKPQSISVELAGLRLETWILYLVSAEWILLSPDCHIRCEALRPKITTLRVTWSVFRGINCNVVRMLFYSLKISTGYKKIIDNLSIGILQLYTTAP